FQHQTRHVPPPKDKVAHSSLLTRHTLLIGIRPGAVRFMVGEVFPKKVECLPFPLEARFRDGRPARRPHWHAARIPPLSPLALRNFSGKRSPRGFGRASPVAARRWRSSESVFCNASTSRKRAGNSASPTSGSGNSGS